MFALIDSAHRGSASDIGCGISSWRLKFDPPDPDLKTLGKARNRIFHIEYSRKPKNATFVFGHPLIEPYQDSVLTDEDRDLGI